MSLHTAYALQWPQAFHILRGRFQHPANTVVWRNQIWRLCFPRTSWPTSSVCDVGLAYSVSMISLVLISFETLLICFCSSASSLYFALISHLGIPDVNKSKASKKMLEWQEAGQGWADGGGGQWGKRLGGHWPDSLFLWQGNSLQTCAPFPAADRAACPSGCSCRLSPMPPARPSRSAGAAGAFTGAGAGPGSSTARLHCLLLFIISVCSFSAWAASPHFRNPAQLQQQRGLSTVRAGARQITGAAREAY